MSENKVVLTQDDVSGMLDSMARGLFGTPVFQRVQSSRLRVYGVPRGGVPVALGIAPRTECDVVSEPCKADFIVDDIYDSGATHRRYRESFPGTPFFTLVDKRDPRFAGKWVVFPWEVTDQGVEVGADDIVLRLLQFIGEDPLREGLKETPRRVLKAWKEWAQGYGQDPREILKTFQDGAEECGDEFVIVSNIPIVSKCEHHLADITGIAHVGYIPNGKIVGLSKLARVTDLFARRLQVQERLTNQIANAVHDVLEAKGTGVIVRAQHACMSSRGVKVHGAVTTTSAMRGALLTNPAARSEFLDLCKVAEDFHA